MNPFVRQYFSFVFFAFYQLFWVLLYLVDLIFILPKYSAPILLYLPTLPLALSSYSLHSIVELTLSSPQYIAYSIY